MEVGLYAEWLGDIYLNWGEGAKALAAYERGSGFVREGQELADYYTKVATAHRLAGAFKEAETFYQKTIDLNLSVVSAYNGLGDMYRDQAVGQITDGNIASATTALETARRSYQKIPFAPVLWGRYDSPQYRAIPPYNLAEVYRLLGSIGAKATPRGAGRVNDFETT